MTRPCRVPAWPSRGRRAQGGSVVVEFAFVFPILFMLIYGTIVYSYVFVINESIHYAAKTAAESAIRVDPAAGDYDVLVSNTARSTASRVLDWMPASQRARFADSTGEAIGSVSFESTVDGMRAVRVELDFDVSESRPAIFPVLTLPFVGEVPPLPDRMRASAIALI
jgi:Flp pilus assembly protein TadG